MNPAVLSGLFAVVPAMLAAPASAAAAPAGMRWEQPVEIAGGRGEKGPWRQNDSRYDYVDDGAVACAPDGGQYVAWVDQNSKDVWLRTVSRDGRLGAPVNVSRNRATFSWQPRVAADPQRPGRLYLLWQEIIFSGGSHGGDILFAHSGDGGRTFSAPLNLSRSTAGDGKGRLDRATWSNGSLDLAIAADGTLLAVWTEYHGALWLARSVDDGARFSAPRRIAGDDGVPARAPALAVGPRGAVHLAWSVGEEPGGAIRVARSQDGGASFAAPQLVGGAEADDAQADARADAPRLALDGAGRLHLVYAVHGGPGGRSEVRYSSAPDAGRFGPARTLSAPGRDAAYPALATNGETVLAVSWENIEHGGMGHGGRAQSLGIAVSRDGGRSFTAASDIPASAAPQGGTNGSQQGLLGQKLAVDAAGRIAVVNSSLVPGRRSRVWLLRAR
jgi:hypothetical protein